MQNKYLIIQYCLDYIPIKKHKKVTVKHIFKWTDFIFYNKIFEIKDIYIYLDNKLKQIK